MQTAARTLIGSTVNSGFFFQSSQLDFSYKQSYSGDVPDIYE